MDVATKGLALAAVAAALPFGLAVACGARSDLSRDDAGAAAGDASLDVVVHDGAHAQRDAGEEDAPARHDGSVIDAAPVPLTVKGTVVDGHLVPMPGLHVRSGGAITTTAADGTFTLTAQGPRYDVVVTTAGSQGHAHGYVFRQVARADPTLQLVADLVPVPAPDTWLHGNTPVVAQTPTGAIWVDIAPVPSTDANWSPIYAFTSPTYPQFPEQYSVPLGWRGPTTIAATGYLLVFQTKALDPVTYETLATQPLTLTLGTTTLWNPPAVSSVPVTTNLVTIDVTSNCIGANTSPYSVYYRVAKGSTAALLAQTTGGTIAVPDAVPGNTIVACYANDCGGVACVADVTPTPRTITIPVPAVSVHASGAVAPGAQVSWTLSGAAVAAYVLEAEDRGSNGPHYFVVTTDSSAALPDLSADGLPFAASDPYAVFVDAFGWAGLATMDDAVGPGGFESVADGVAVPATSGPPLTGFHASAAAH
jgi:hypothetical protein